MSSAAAIAALCVSLALTGAQAQPDVLAQRAGSVLEKTGMVCEDVVAGMQSAVRQTAAARMKYIMHAGGRTPEGTAGTNSLEALELSYEKGYRTFEIDMSWTADTQLVCVHSWGEADQPPLARDFAAQRGEGENTSLMVVDLYGWLREHPDAWVVTDIKDRNLMGAATIARRFPDVLDRTILQIYSFEEYDEAWELGFRHIILTVYQMTGEERADTEALVEFARTHPLEGLTFPVEMVQKEGYVESLLAGDTPLFVHTVNGREKQEQLFAQGISGIYTDNGAS